MAQATSEEVEAEISRLRALARHVGASRKHANDLSELIDSCSSPEPRVALAAVQSCRALFDAWARSADLVAMREGDPRDAMDATAVYRRWLFGKYTVWLDALGVLVARHEGMGVRLPALDSLLCMARTEALHMKREGEAATASLSRAEGAFGIACAALSACAECEPLLLAHLRRGYLLRYCDCSYSAMQHVAALAQRLAQRNRCTPAKCARLLDLLIVVRLPSADLDPGAARFLALDQPEPEPEAGAGAGAAEPGAGKAKAKRKRSGACASGSGSAPPLPADALRLCLARTQRLAFQAAWLAVLRLPLARSDVRRVLARLEDKVVPLLPRPLQLAGWVLRAYEGGGLVALLALSALYLLMQQHGLECPAFFAHLYRLVDAKSLESKYRERFFLLAELFLSSALLPAYLTAAFVKRLARLALTASPSGCQVALALALNLLVRHPELSALVHRSPSAGVAELGAQSPGAEEAGAEEAGAEGALLGDRFLADEPLPERSRALESSLWEVQTLRGHFLPAVAQIAEQFALQMHGPGARVVRLQLDDYTPAGYASLAKQELRWRRGRATPLAFKKRRALFGDDEPGVAGLGCFLGQGKPAALSTAL